MNGSKRFRDLLPSIEAVVADLPLSLVQRDGDMQVRRRSLLSPV